MTERTVTRLHPAHRDDLGDLVTRRPVPGPGLDRVGAFLFLNHHGPQVYPPNNQGLPFGPHPHRGFETVTFVLDGEIAHADSAGHQSIIGKGGIQWMTAGSGIVHEERSPERFRREGGALDVIQLWLNLPARLKMTRPRYLGARAEAIPAVAAENGAMVRVVSGSWGGAQGPAESITGTFLALVEAPAGGRVTFDGLAGRDVLVYAARGSLTVGGRAVPQYHLATLGDGARVTIEAAEPAILLFGHAAPIDEPVVAYGPFVMNTAEEIHQAIADYQAGRFGMAEIVEA